MDPFNTEGQIFSNQRNSRNGSIRNQCVNTQRAGQHGYALLAWYMRWCSLRHRRLARANLSFTPTPSSPSRVATSSLDPVPEVGAF